MPKDHGSLKQPILLPVSFAEPCNLIVANDATALLFAGALRGRSVKFNPIEFFAAHCSRACQSSFERFPDIPAVLRIGKAPSFIESMWGFMGGLACSRISTDAAQSLLYLLQAASAPEFRDQTDNMGSEIGFYLRIRPEKIEYAAVGRGQVTGRNIAAYNTVNSMNEDVRHLKRISQTLEERGRQPPRFDEKGCRYCSRKPAISSWCLSLA
jgi:hypothetical protein